MNTPNNNVSANGEDLATLEAEISELHRENARVEGQMLRLKSDINAIETHLTHGDRVRFTPTLLPSRTGWLKQKISCNLNFYYTTINNPANPTHLNLNAISLFHSFIQSFMLIEQQGWLLVESNNSKILLY